MKVVTLKNVKYKYDITTTVHLVYRSNFTIIVIYTKNLIRICDHL